MKEYEIMKLVTAAILAASVLFNTINCARLSARVDELQHELMLLKGDR